MSARPFVIQRARGLELSRAVASATCVCDWCPGMVLAESGSARSNTGVGRLSSQRVGGELLDANWVSDVARGGCLGGTRVLQRAWRSAAA